LRLNISTTVQTAAVGQILHSAERILILGVFAVLQTSSILACEIETTVFC